VAQIDPRPFLVKVKQAEANLTTARAQVEKDKADLTFKQRAFKRTRELFERNLIAKQEVEAAERDVEQAQAQYHLDLARVEQNAAALEEAQVNLGYTDIVSPVDGVVVSRSVNVGQTVAASFQTPVLFQVAQDLTKMQVNTNVSESDIGLVAEGQRAFFAVDAYPERKFWGTITQVRNAPQIVQNVSPTRKKGSASAFPLKRRTSSSRNKLRRSGLSIFSRNHSKADKAAAVIMVAAEAIITVVRVSKVAVVNTVRAEASTRVAVTSEAAVETGQINATVVSRVVEIATYHVSLKRSTKKRSRIKYVKHKPSFQVVKAAIRA
jgi:biotin carboxyl carrier protein